MTRPWYRSKWLLIGGVLVLLGLALALAIPSLIQVDRYRPLLVRLIETNTGRQVQIDALKLHVVPTVHIEADNFRMRNPQGFPAGDAISVKSIDLGLAVGALLSRRLEVTYITLNGIRVNLLRDPAGRTNFDLPAPARSAPPASTTPTAGGGAPLTLDRVGEVALEDAEITSASSDPRHPEAAPQFTLSGLNARVRSIDLKTPDWPQRLEVVANLRGVRLATPVLAKPVEFQSGEIHYKGGAVQGTFSASLDTLHVSATAAVASINPPSTATFTVTIPELDVNKIQRLVHSSASSSVSSGGTPTTSKAPAPPAQQRLLARGDVKIDKLIFAPYEATKVTGQVSVSTNTVRLDSVAFSTFGGNVQGAAALDYAAATLPTSVTAKLHGINLGQAVSAIYPQARKLTGALDADLKLTTALARDPMAALSGSGTFSASLNNMRAAGTAAIASLNPLSATFSVAIPELDVNKLQSLGFASGSGGSSAGGGTLGSAGGPPTTSKAPGPPAQQRLLARGDVKIDKLVLAPLVPLEATQVRGHVGVYTNTVQLDPVSLSAYGGTLQGVAVLDYSAASLPVTGTVKARGVNMERVVKALAPQARKLTGTLEADLKLATALGKDPMAALTGDGTFAVRNGVFQGLDIRKDLAQMAKALQLNVPAGETRFSYFGGDIRIAQQRAFSNSLRLQADGLDGTAKGSVGFDRTLNFVGIGTLKVLSSGPSPSGGPSISVGQILGQLVPAAAGITGARVPFLLKGTFDNPNFSLTGTPELIRGTSPQQQPSQQPKQQPQQPTPPDIFKLFQ